RAGLETCVCHAIRNARAPGALKGGCMPARTGQQYIAALKRMKPCIYLQGRRVDDVTEETIFQGPIQTIAQLYDLQHDPRYRDFMTYPSPTTGEPVPSSFLVPYSQEDVNKK